MCVDISENRLEIAKHRRSGERFCDDLRFHDSTELMKPPGEVESRLPPGCKAQLQGGEFLHLTKHGGNQRRGGGAA
jgi:hypothetical protein